MNDVLAMNTNQGSQLYPLEKGSTGIAHTTASLPSTSSKESGEVSSSDFLTLLVTELKNQDPTQPTDPNAYIQQLVGVNSLQQLISINQELQGTSTTAGTVASSNLVSGT